jgi:hypothetical protein
MGKRTYKRREEVADDGQERAAIKVWVFLTREEVAAVEGLGKSPWKQPIQEWAQAAVEAKIKAT